MQVKYKSIEHERTQDAPFVGAMVSAVGCPFNCPGCFNQHLKDMPTLYSTAEGIIAEIKKNPFNEGIILGGLEWSTYPVELYNLVRTASRNGLKVMIYTGMTEKEFDQKVGVVLLGAFINDDFYIKFGEYAVEQEPIDKVEFGVNLASSNQYIVKFKKDGSRCEVGGNSCTVC